MRRALVLLAVSAAAAGETYAVLAAGSKTYLNYRHQADIAHGYQVLTQGGVPAANIVTLMYDDVAHDRANPFPGQLFNKPTLGAGWDVYAGLAIDYRGENATAQNFLNVLTGNATGGGRVLNTTAEDDVFVYFADHGGPGLLEFPAGPYLYAKELTDALQAMHAKQMYRQLVIYVDACESGSMFVDLPNNTNIYTVASASPYQSAYAAYCPPWNETVNGTHVDSCMSDLFSACWLESIDTRALDGTTLQAQFAAVRTRMLQHVFNSDAMQYGDTAVARGEAATFEGVGHIHPLAPGRKTCEVVVPGQVVDARDVKLATLHGRYRRAVGGAAQGEAARALAAEVAWRERADALFAELAHAVLGSPDATGPGTVTVQQLQPACYRAAHEALRQCGAYDDYSLKHSRTTKMLCDTTLGDTRAILSAIDTMCARFAH